MWNMLACPSKLSPVDFFSDIRMSLHGDSIILILIRLIEKYLIQSYRFNLQIRDLHLDWNDVIRN